MVIEQISNKINELEVELDWMKANPRFSSKDIKKIENFIQNEKIILKELNRKKYGI